MVKQPQDRHPDLDMLVDYSADASVDHVVGVLDQPQREAVEQHLATCAQCRLEVKRLARFAVIDQDEELLAKADWNEARFAMERGYQDQVKAAIGIGATEDAGAPETPAQRVDAPATAPVVVEPQRSFGHRFNPHLRWLVPAAAAAILAAVFFYTGPDMLKSQRGAPGDVGSQIFRGDAEQAPIIVPQSPVGRIAEMPTVFHWDSERAFDSYTLEVATTDLENVFKQTGIDSTSFELPDSLRARLQPGSGYLWNVQGHEGLTAAVISETFWFEVGGEIAD